MKKLEGWARVPHTWEQLEGNAVMSEREAWLWMCRWAAHYTESEAVLSPPCASYVAKSLGWDNKKFSRYLAKLERLKMVCVKRHGSAIEIFIVLSHLRMTAPQNGHESATDNKNKTKKVEYTSDFSVAWADFQGNAYTTARSNKKSAYRAWQNLSAAEKLSAGKQVKAYLEGAGSYHKAMERWLRDADFNEDVIVPKRRMTFG